MSITCCRMLQARLRPFIWRKLGILTELDGGRLHRLVLSSAVASTRSATCIGAALRILFETEIYPKPESFSSTMRVHYVRRWTRADFMWVVPLGRDSPNAWKLKGNKKQPMPRGVTWAV